MICHAIFFSFFFVLFSYLALAGALATEADFVFIPEWPPETGWADVLCKKLKQASFRCCILIFHVAITTEEWFWLLCTIPACHVALILDSNGFLVNIATNKKHIFVANRNATMDNVLILSSSLKEL